MTRRILLTLADDATDTHCGSCQYVHDVTAWCVPFWDGASAGAGGIRDPRCLAAEAAAKQDDDDRAEGAKMRQIRELLRADAYDNGEPLTFERLERAAGKVQP